MSIEGRAAMFREVADHRELAADDDEYGDVDMAALEEIVIDLRDSVVRPASSDVAVLHLARMVAAVREEAPDPGAPR